MSLPKIKQIEGLQAAIDNVAGGSIGRLNMAGPIKQIVVETPTDTIDIQGLSFDVDGEYLIMARVQNGESSGGTDYSLYAGDPTLNETDGDYDTVRVQNGAPVGGMANHAYWANTTNQTSVFSVIRVTVTPDGRLRVNVDTNQDVGTVLDDYMIRSSVTFGAVTRLRLKAGTSSGFGVGTSIRVYRYGGSLSTGTSIGPLDVKRAADGFDEEFVDATLDANKWTTKNATIGTVDFGETGTVEKYDLTTRSGWLLTQVRSSNVLQLRRDYSLAVGESVVVKVSPGFQYTGSSTDTQQFGILLNDTDSDYVAGEYAGVLFVDQDASNAYDAAVFSSANMGGLNVQHPTLLNAGGPCFIRFTREADGYVFHASRDGTSWHQLGKTNNYTELTNIWLYHKCTTSPTVAPIVCWDWVRLGDGTALDPWPLVDGSTVKPVAVGEWRGVQLTKSSDQSHTGGAATDVTWQTVVEDTDGFWPGGATTTVVIPAGVSRIRALVGIRATGGSTGDAVISIHKNGSKMDLGGVSDNNTVDASDIMQASSADVRVVEGDEIKAVFECSNSRTITDLKAMTFFEVKVIEPIVAITDKGTVNISSADSPYTMPNTKKTVYVTADGATTVNFYALADNNLQEVEVKIISGTGVVTLDGNASELIEGAATYAFSGVGECRTFKAKSINGDLGWYLVARASLDPASLVSFACTATEAVNDVVYVSAADTVAQADASALGTARATGWIFAKPTTTTCLVSFGPGPIPASGLTPGAPVYLSDTAGAVSASEGTVVVEVGIAKSTTSFIFTGAKVIA